MLFDGFDMLFNIAFALRFTPETNVSGVFLLPGKIGICWDRLFTHLANSYLKL